MLTRKRIGIITMVCIAIISVMAVMTHHKKQDWQPVREGPIISAIYGLGTIYSDQVFTLTAGVTKYIKTIYVKAGEKVKKGQMLLQYHDGQIVYAPFSGIVTAKTTFANEVTNPKTPILTVTNPKKRYLLVSMDQDSLLNMKQAKDAVISFAALPEEKFTGTIQSIYSDEHNFYVRLQIQHLPESILPGMTADVAIITHAIKNSVQIPLKALKINKVTYKANGVEKTVIVHIGTQANGWGQVLSNNIPVNAQVLLS